MSDSNRLYVQGGIMGRQLEEFDYDVIKQELNRFEHFSVVLSKKHLKKLHKVLKMLNAEKISKVTACRYIIYGSYIGFIYPNILLLASIVKTEELSFSIDPQDHNCIIFYHEDKMSILN